MNNCPDLYQDIGKKARASEILPGITTLFRFLIPDSGKVELRFLHEYLGIAAGVGVQANEQGPFRGNGYSRVINLSGVAGNYLFSLGTDMSSMYQRGHSRNSGLI